MSYWKCIKSLSLKYAGTDTVVGVAFTAGKVYQGEPNHATPGGEWAMQFIDDFNEPHLMTSEGLHEHFVRVITEAEKEANS